MLLCFCKKEGAAQEIGRYGKLRVGIAEREFTGIHGLVAASNKASRV